LANLLPDSHNRNSSLLRGPTRIAKVIAGIALAMRHVHSQRVIHGNLTPDNILIDWDWNVRIANFGHSILTNSLITDTHIDRTFRGDAHYVAPECYEDRIGPENDVFSFGLILYEIIVGQPVFSKSLLHEDIVPRMITNRFAIVWPSTIGSGCVSMESLIDLKKCGSN
jgi:serine/threonine protein kinase